MTYRFSEAPSLISILETLLAETGQTIPEIRAVLKRAGAAVFCPLGQDFGRLYLRKAVESAFPRKLD